MNENKYNEGAGAENAAAPTSGQNTTQAPVAPAADEEAITPAEAPAAGEGEEEPADEDERGLHAVEELSAPAVEA